MSTTTKLDGGTRGRERETVAEPGQQKRGPPHGISLTLTIVAEAHLGLTQADCVLAGTNAVKLFKLTLLHILSIGSCQRCRHKTTAQKIGEAGGGARSREERRWLERPRDSNTHLAGAV